MNDSQSYLKGIEIRLHNHLQILYSFSQSYLKGIEICQKIFRYHVLQHSQSYLKGIEIGVDTTKIAQEFTPNRT